MKFSRLCLEGSDGSEVIASMVAATSATLRNSGLHGFVRDALSKQTQSEVIALRQQMIPMLAQELTQSIARILPDAALVHLQQRLQIACHAEAECIIGGVCSELQDESSGSGGTPSTKRPKLQERPS